MFNLYVYIERLSQHSKVNNISKVNTMPKVNNIPKVNMSTTCHRLVQKQEAVWTGWDDARALSLSLSPPSLTHTPTPTHTLSLSHTHTQTHTHSLSRSLTLSRRCGARRRCATGGARSFFLCFSASHTHTHIHPPTHTLSLFHTHSLSLTHTPTHSLFQSLSVTLSITGAKPGGGVRLAGTKSAIRAVGSHPSTGIVSSRGVGGSGHGYNSLLKMVVGARKVN